MAHPLATGLRTHPCAVLTAQDDQKEVTLAGWVDSRRDHGGLYFFDLRDRSGLVQVVAEPEHAEVFKTAEGLGAECVVQVTGVVRRRQERADDDHR